MTTQATSTFPRTGNSTGNRAPILNRPIPSGGFGRCLTSAEIADLRALGWRGVSNSAIVVREVADLDYLGIVYYPGRPDEHTFANADIYVCTR